jgi:hypothetical protein
MKSGVVVVHRRDTADLGATVKQLTTPQNRASRTRTDRANILQIIVYYGVIGEFERSVKRKRQQKVVVTQREA